MHKSSRIRNSSFQRLRMYNFHSATFLELIFGSIMSLCFKEISYPCSLFHTKASIVDIHDTSFQFMLRLFLKDSTACLQK